MKLYHSKIIRTSSLAMFIVVLMTYACNKTDEPIENKTPTCSITSPDNVEEIQQGEIITISVDAVDSDGKITEVRFFIDGTEYGALSNLPYNYNWYTESAETGSHTLKAVAIDNDGSSAEDEITIILTEGGSAPVADFAASQTSINPDSSIQFTDLSTNTPTSWNWDFSDGVTSTLQNPLHTYSSPGNYKVSLTVTNNFGSDTEIKISYITVLTIDSETGTVSDYDGNTYKTIKIGDQWWMAENVKTTHFSNGTPISLIENASDWNSLGNDDKAMSFYDNSSTNANTYGALYTWAAAMNGAISSDNNPSGIQGVCPDGWHLPSDAEWKQLEMYLGMSLEDANTMNFSTARGTNEGSKLAGNAELWEDGQLEIEVAFGTSGFTALPGGNRYYDGSFNNLGNVSHFWSATDTVYNGTSEAWYRMLVSGNSDVIRLVFLKNSGFSVRCVKD